MIGSFSVLLQSKNRPKKSHQITLLPIKHNGNVMSVMVWFVAEQLNCLAEQIDRLCQVRVVCSAYQCDIIVNTFFIPHRCGQHSVQALACER